MKLRLEWVYAKRLLIFSTMPMITMLLGPIVQITIRTFISSEGSWTVIGEWQAINKISDAYMMVISMFLLNYFVPILSPIKDKSDLVEKLKPMLLKLLVFAILVFGMSVFIKKWIVLLLYSQQYLHITDILVIQFLGDFFRVIAFGMVYLLIAKAQVKLFICVESISTVCLLVLTILGYQSFGLEGMVYGYLLNAIVFLFISVVATTIYWRGIKSK